MRPTLGTEFGGPRGRGEADMRAVARLLVLVVAALVYGRVAAETAVR